MIDVLARMKVARQPMAVVLDEFGGTAGIVTLKDLVARLLGNVGDEYAPATQEVRALADGTIVADGLARVEDVNAQLGTHFDDSEVDSLGGLVFSRARSAPASWATRLSSTAATAHASNAWTACASRVCRLMPPKSVPTAADQPPSPVA